MNSAASRRSLSQNFISSIVQENMNINNEVEKTSERGRSAVTNTILLDTSTLISLLVIIVFIIKLFNRVMQSNSAGNLVTAAGRARPEIIDQNHIYKIFVDLFDH
jgi:hypothetical protein